MEKNDTQSPFSWFLIFEATEIAIFIECGVSAPRA
jgi:hypothetical protein